MIPVVLAGVGGPIVTPPRVMVMFPAGMGLLPTARTTELEPMDPLVIVVIEVEPVLTVEPDGPDVSKDKVALMMVLATFRESAVLMLAKNMLQLFV